ncbi:hypothetical protein Tco_0008274 [Tanacetum coccineum]
MGSTESILQMIRSNPPVSLIDTEESDDVSKVIFDMEKFSSQQSITPVIPPPLAYTSPPPFLATMKPLDNFLMGDEVISTTPVRESDEFIKSSVEDLVPILRESEVILVSTDLECSMPVDSPPLPCTDVLGDAKVDIDLPFREHLDTLSIGNREINFSPCRDIEELESLLTDDPIPDPRMFDVSLGTSDSMSRSIETKGDIRYLEQLLNEDTSSDLSPAFLPTETSLLVLPLPDPKKIFLREVERFDPFFSLTQLGDMTWVMERPSYKFPHMPLPPSGGILTYGGDVSLFPSTLNIK